MKKVLIIPCLLFILACDNKDRNTQWSSLHSWAYTVNQFGGRQKLDTWEIVLGP